MTSEDDFASLETAVGAQPTDASAWCQLGLAYYRVEQYELAAEVFRQATLFAPEKPIGWWGLAVALSSLQEREEALRAARRAAELAPLEPYVLVRLGRELLLSSRPHEAKGVLSGLVGRLPRWPRARGLLGLAQYHAGDYAAAVETLEASLRADPDDRPLWAALGVSLAELERFAEAANALETAVFLSPDHGEAWGRLGQARSGLGRHREAVDAFERAVDLGFAPFGLWIDLGRSAAEVRDLGALGRAYEELREDRPEEAERLKQKLEALQRRGQAGHRGRHGRGAKGFVERALAELGMSKRSAAGSGHGRGTRCRAPTLEGPR
jgi:Flp pilus assembly protein TadD